MKIDIDIQGIGGIPYTSKLHWLPHLKKETIILLG